MAVDQALAMYNDDAREYDPATGRFTVQDPLGLAADANPYRFAGNSPTDASDPTGLSGIGNYFAGLRDSLKEAANNYLKATGNLLRAANALSTPWSTPEEKLDAFQTVVESVNGVTDYAIDEYNSLYQKADYLRRNVRTITNGSGSPTTTLARPSFTTEDVQDFEELLKVSEPPINRDDYDYSQDFPFHRSKGEHEATKVLGGIAIMEATGRLIPLFGGSRSGPVTSGRIEEANPFTRMVREAEEISPSGRMAREAEGTLCPRDVPNCFPPDTPVATEAGPRPIGEVAAGDRVWAYDFLAGLWGLCAVERRHDSVYDGPIVTLETDAGRATATAFHPFWVVRGDDLTGRPTPRHLGPDEDQGGSLPGRWVNSHEVREGDAVFLRGQGAATIRRVTLRPERMPVCNLTVEGLHSFAAGEAQALVHNVSGTPGNVAPNSGPIKPASRQDIVNSMGKGSFQDKINAGRDMIRRAKEANPEFLAQEARSLKGDFLFIGSGQRPGLKNVVVVRPDGSVLRMEFDPSKIKPIGGGGGKIFDVDLSGAELLVPGG